MRRWFRGIEVHDENSYLSSGVGGGVYLSDEWYQIARAEDINIPGTANWPWVVWWFTVAFSVSGTPTPEYIVCAVGCLLLSPMAGSVGHWLSNTLRTSSVMRDTPPCFASYSTTFPTLHYCGL